MKPPDNDLSGYFQQLYGQDSDPWQVRQRWYEQRKRALVLASLPLARYDNAYEPGCGNGELTVQLAPRCKHLLATDLSAQAVALTQARLAQDGRCGHVAVTQQNLPHDWPRAGGRPFDLILISEFAYYLEADALALLVEHSAATLAPHGTLLLCHWRPPFKQRLQSTARVHAAFRAAPGLQRLVHHEEDDFLLDLWSADGRSVAQREGLR